MKKLNVRRDDSVIVVSGDDKGKKGKVLQVSPEEGKIIVEGLNKVSKHVKPRRQGETGGIVEAEAPMYACKVQPFCSKCGKGVRVKAKILDGKKIRVCAKCGEAL